MSLAVWLPLTKDLRNQGLSDVTVTNNGATFNSEGKLGGCYYFNASAYLYENTYDWTNFNTSEFSLCCWYKEPSPVASGNSQMICIGTSSGWNNIRIGLLRRTSNGYPMFSVSDGTNNVNYTFTADSFALDTWNHIVCTYNNGTMKMYLNGELHKTSTTTIVPALNSSQHLGIGAASNGSEKLTGYLNDVRIYDHCLSETEIKKLAQGLVLHYPLNRNGWGQENLLLSTPRSYNTTSYNFIQLSLSETLVANQTYTLQLWGLTLDGNSSGTLPYWGGGSNPLYPNGASYLKPDSNGYLKYTFTVTSANVSHSQAVNKWINLYNFVNNHTGISATLEKWKLEKGSVATPWCPNSSDELAISMGLDNSTEYDISGFCNNGTRIGFPQQNLLFGSDFSSQYTTDLVTNSSTDWTKYLRGYNSATNHSFSNGEDTVTLNAAANLGVCFARKATDINLNSNEYYTLSCEAKSTQTAKPLCIGLSYYNNSNTWVWRGGSNPTNFTATNTWQKFSLTFKPDADTQYICYCFTVVGVASGTDTFTIRHCKLEKGSTATLWVNGESNSWTSDTPKYTVSTYFEDYTNTLQAPLVLTTPTAITMAVWVKGSSTGRGNYQMPLNIDSSAYEFSLAGSTGNFRQGFYINGSRSVLTTNSKTILDGQWHHLAATYDGTTIRRYVDGEEVSGSATNISGSLATSSKLYISTYGTNLTYGNVKLYESDVRIYATALSATDVKSLYQNTATIDADGTIHGQIRS